MSLARPAIGLPRSRSASASASLGPLAVVVCLAGALALRVASPANSDVSWLLDVGNQWLDGRRPYVDLIEVNPPASILIYMPAVVAARILGISPELATILMVTLGAVGSLLFTGCILARDRVLDRGELYPLLSAGLLVALVLPADSFAQREHIAVLTGLPMLAAIAARVRGLPVSFRTALGAGLGCGITLAVKPVFILGFAGPVFYLLLVQGWRVSLAASEIWIAGLVAAVYGVGVLVAVPAFRDEILPMVLATYVPLRRSLPDLALSPIAVCWMSALVAALLVRRRRGGNAWLNILILASSGFAACYLIQGKGFLYHALPALMFALAAVVSGLGIRSADRWFEPGLLLGAAAFGLSILVLAQHLDLRDEAPGLAAAVQRVSKHPTMVVISSHIAVGHPFVREVDGRWVGSFASNWLAACIARLEARSLSPVTRANLDRIGDYERSRVAQDIAERRPDVILVDDDRWMDWVIGWPALARTFDAYRREGQYGSIALWVRTSAGAAPPDATTAGSLP